MTKMTKQLVQQLSVAVGTKGPILDYLLVEFLTPILLNSVGLAIFIEFYIPRIMSYTCNKCGKVVSDKWAHNIEHTYREWDEEQVFFKLNSLICDDIFATVCYLQSSIK